MQRLGAVPPEADPRSPSCGTLATAHFERYVSLHASQGEAHEERTPRAPQLKTQAL